MTLVFFNRTETLLDTQVLVGTPNQTLWATPYYVNVPALLAGDRIRITAEQEIECLVAYNTEMVSEVIYGPSWCPNDTDLQTGYYLDRAIGNDASNNPIHYWNAVRASEFQLPSNYPAGVIQFRIRCRSTSAPGTDYNSFKGNGYGHLSVSVERG